MLIDKRTYTYHPSQFGTFLKSYATLGFPLTTKHLGTTLGIFTSASGVANQTVQLFAYEDHDHRDACRAGLLNDPAWLDFVRLSGPYIRQAGEHDHHADRRSALRGSCGVNAVREEASGADCVGRASAGLRWLSSPACPGPCRRRLKLIEDDGSRRLRPPHRHAGRPFRGGDRRPRRFFVLPACDARRPRRSALRALRPDPTTRA